MKFLKIWLIISTFSITVSCGQQNRYLQYKVKAGETMSSIAEKLKMKTKDLLRLNPDAAETLRADTFIIVPENKYEFFKNQQLKNNVVIEEIDTKSSKNLTAEREKLIATLQENFVVYEVKKGDTFYSLEKKYQVTTADLILLNPELKNGLKEGSILKIKELEKENQQNKAIYTEQINSKKSIKLALLLPFRSDVFGYDSISPKEIFLKNATLVHIATDLYLGAEMAIDSLRKKGLNIELNVYDTGARKSNKIKTIIAENNLNENDLIIGPLYSEEAQMVAAAINIPLIFPVYSANQSEFKNTNIIKASPNKKLYKEVMIRYINDNFDSGNLIVIGNKVENSLQIKNELTAKSTGRKISILTPNNGIIQKSKFLEILNPNQKNWIILDSENEVLISDVINSLIGLPEKTAVTVFTFEKGTVYDKIDNTKLAKIGFTYVSEVFVDETSEATKQFNKNYFEKNNSIPTYYATKGFDITYDMLVRIASGKKLLTTFKEGVSERVENKFVFKNNPTLENEGVFILKINKDLSLSKIEF